MAISALLHLPRTELRSGTLEAAKWLALVCMVVDHVNAVFFDRSLGLGAEVVGRLAMPLFSLVLAYNLARPGLDLDRVLNRLALFGLAALPWHAGLFAQVGGWWPLNILSTFAVAVLVIRELEAGRFWLAGLFFVAGGSLVEYWWPGVALVVVAFYRFRSPTPLASPVTLFFSLLTLCLVNGNPWALLAIPLLHGLNRLDLQVPRLRWVFWAFYPVHLCVLWLLVHH